MTPIGVKQNIAINCTYWHNCLEWQGGWGRVLKIGEKVRWYRLLSGHDQDSLASSSRISRKALSDIERGKVNQKTATLEKVSDGLKRPLTDLVGRPFRHHEIKELKDDELLSSEDLHERLQFILESKQDLWVRAIAANIHSIFNTVQDSLRKLSDGQKRDSNQATIMKASATRR